MGILRKAFILGAVVLALPNPPASETPDGVVPPTTSTFAYVAAASEAFADVRSFCERRPEVCTVAGQIAANLEVKAKYGAKIVYEWADSGAEIRAGARAKAGGEDVAAADASTNDMANADPMPTATTVVKKQAKPEKPASRPLTMEDLIQQ